MVISRSFFCLQHLLNIIRNPSLTMLRGFVLMIESII